MSVKKASDNLQIQNRLPNKEININSRSIPNLLFSSSISCFVANLLTNPLQAAKLRIQYQTANCSLYPHSSFKDIHKRSCSQSIAAQDIFKGLSISLPQSIIMNMLYMTFCQKLRTKMNQTLTNHNIINTLVSAVAVRSTLSLILMPVQAFRVKSMNSTSTNTIRTNTWGTKVTLIRDVSYTAMMWVIIQAMRSLCLGEQFRRSNHKLSDNYWNITVLPAIVGSTIASLITTPFDTLKTRLQSGIKYEQNSTIKNQLKSMYRVQGLGGIYCGVQHRVAKSIISTIIYLSLFEFTMEKFSKSE